MNISELLPNFFGGNEPKVDKYGGENPRDIVDGRDQTQFPPNIKPGNSEPVVPEEIPVVTFEQTQTHQSLIDIALKRFPGRDRDSFHPLPETVPQTDIVGIEFHALRNVPPGESVLFIDKVKEDPDKADSGEIAVVSMATVIDEHVISLRTLARVDEESTSSPAPQTSG